MKNETMEVLKNRRSVRAFKEEQVPRELLEAVLEAGIYAPTAKGMQTPWVIALQNKEDRDAAAALNAKVFGKPDIDPYYGAPTIILIVAPDDGFAELNGSAVCENMLIAAEALGLSTCWIHRSQGMFDMEEGKALLKKWGLDENVRGVASIALGYAAAPAPAPKARKENYCRII